jgi:23S rRNA (guanosine2251-2'-O)-methyltransferase
VRPAEDPRSLVVSGANAVLELLRSGHPVTRLHLGTGAREAEVGAAARALNVPVAAAVPETLDQLAGSRHHQGVVAVASPFRYVPLEILLGPECRAALVLDGIQDPRNLGAILRTARAAGVGGVVLPADRCVGVTSVVVSAAAGLLFGMPIAREPNLVRAMEAMKGAGFWLVGLVARGGSPLFGFESPPRPALVVGGEGEGLRSLVARTSDFSVSIPMAPGVESLNVAVATGIALYEIVVRRASI